MTAHSLDRIMDRTLWICALAVSAVFLFIIIDLLWQGFEGLSPSFLFSAPKDAGRAGGIFPILVATSLIIGLCICIAAPLALLAGIYLSDVGHRSERLGRWIGHSLDTLAGVPSIVFGLFGNAVFAHYLGLRVSILTGALTLAVMILPFLVRSVEDALRSLPAEYRQASAALGISRASAMRHILLPAALPGLGAGLIIGLGRALAETAALLFTSGYVTRMPDSVLEPGRALSVHIFDLAMNVPGGSQNAYKSACVLVVLLLLINGSVRFFSNRASINRN